MDQVKTILGVIWQQRFWLLSVIGVVVAVFCWMSASGDLDSEFSKRKSAIKNAFTAVKGLNSKPLHANNAVIEGNTKEANQEAEITYEIWSSLYNRQREEVLSWPKDHLDDTFISEIEKLNFRDEFPSKLASFMRSNYYNYIEKQFDEMLAIVKAQKSKGSRGGRGFGGAEEGYARGRGGEEEETEDYLVQWVDQGKLQSQLQFKSPPTAVQIWVTQENLWVYENLLNVIAATNQARGATRPDNAAIRAIIALQVGQDAVSAGKSKGNIVGADADAAGGRGYGGGEGGGYGGEGGYGGGYGGGGYGGGEGDYGRGGYGGEGGYGDGYGGGAPVGEDTTEIDNQALAFRYLNSSTGEPYPGDAGNFGTEFRQLPVRMVLLMDQSWLPHVLVECANASLPVEVKKLRVNPSMSGSGFGKSSRGSRKIKGLGALQNDDSMIEIELYGVVYIYKKPDRAQLGLPEEESADEEQFADAT